MSVIAEPVSRILSESLDVLNRIQSGEYTVHGGVVRHAAGTERGGQIVGHLKYPSNPQKAQESLSNLQNTLQSGLSSLEGGMNQLQQSMNVLQGLQVANLALSGLNLAVSVAGFAIVCSKLNKISLQIERQSAQINQTLNLALKNHERNLLDDEAEFRTLVISAQQFCALGDVEQLRVLLPRLTKQYEFTKLVLQKLADEPASNVDQFDEVELLHGRFTNLGLLLSHVKIRANAPLLASEQMRHLSEDLIALSHARIEALTNDQDTAFRLPKERLAQVVSLLSRNKEMLPALAYQADLIDLESAHPNAVLDAPESDEILFLAAA